MDSGLVDPFRRLVLQMRCPWCRAQPGFYCTIQVMKERKEVHWFHASRYIGLEEEVSHGIISIEQVERSQRPFMDRKIT